MPVNSAQPLAADSDEALVARIASHDEAGFELLMRRYNSRLFRVARAILKSDADAEDVLQDTYLEAYRHIADFRSESHLSTWLTRIAINQALMRLRQLKRERVIVPFARKEDESGTEQSPGDIPDRQGESPSDAALRGEIRRILERKVDSLPAGFRVVLVMRDIEDMTIAETSECLGIPSATVRTRLFRARALLRDALARDLDTAAAGLFSFDGARCDRIVAAVLQRLHRS